MKKRLFAIMLALTMMLAAVPALAEEGEATEVPETSTKIICKVCEKEVESVDENGLCEACAAKKTAEEEAAKKAAEEEALRKAAEEEAAKKAAEEAAKKAAEEAAKKAAEGKTEGLKATPGETNQAGTGTTNGCNHEHTKGWGGTMEEHPAKAATCTSEGNIKYYTCNVCKGYFVRDESIEEKIVAIPSSAEKVKIQKISHTPNKVNGKPATCTEAGNIEYYECSDCKGKFKDEKGENPVNDVVIPALGHSIPVDDNEYTSKPTCTTAGKATYKCSKCNTTLENVEIPALGHSYGSPSWSWCGFTSAKATFTCTRNCGHSETETASIVRNRINNCGYYTYTATVQFNGNTYTDTRTDYSCRPDWYYDPCYYTAPCGHWGCGGVCTRYSDCVPCRNYRTTFRVGGYNCLATPKTGDVSVIGMALITLAGTGAAVMGKKRK